MFDDDFISEYKDRFLTEEVERCSQLGIKYMYPTAFWSDLFTIIQ